MRSVRVGGVCVGGGSSGEFEEVARLRVLAVRQQESNRCFAGKWGESPDLPRGGRRGGGGGGGQCSGGRHTSTARMEVQQGRICSLDRSKFYHLYAAKVSQLYTK